MERPVQFANARNRIAGLRRLLSGRTNRIRAHVSAASGFGALASEFDPGRSAFADARAHLVDCPAGRISGALGGASAESGSTVDDFMLVHQQLVRSIDRRRSDALSRRRTDSIHEPSKRRHFLSLRSIHWSVFVLVFRRGVCRMESLGPRHLLGVDPNTIFFKRLGGINNGAVDRNVGDERNSGPANGLDVSRFLEAWVLFLGLLSVSYAVLYEFGSGADSALLFLPLPFLLWAAVRFGSLGASSAISIVGFLAIWSGSHGHGPFSGGTAEQNALAIQIFLIVLAIPILFLATAIEERVTGETELRESESRFRVVSNTAPVMIWMSGRDKLCTFFNKPWLEFTGRRWSRKWEMAGPKACTQTICKSVSMVMSQRLMRGSPSSCNTGSGETMANIAGFRITVCRVTTPRKISPATLDRAQISLNHWGTNETLREFEERVRLAAEAAHLGVWELDAATNEIWISDSARALFQFDSETRVNHALLQDRVHPEDRALRDSAVKAAIETYGEYEIEYRVLLPDGTLRWIGGRGRCVTGENGKGTRLIGVSIDITPRKLAEAEARLPRRSRPSQPSGRDG